jgi:hypothetical protein
MALSQEVAQQLADAYGAGDIDTVNSLLSGGVNAEDVQKFWNFDEAAMADLLGKGVSFAEPSKADKAVENGGHLMVYTNADSVSNLIRARLEKG